MDSSPAFRVVTLAVMFGRRSVAFCGGFVLLGCFIMCVLGHTILLQSLDTRKNA